MAPVLKDVDPPGVCNNTGGVSHDHGGDEALKEIWWNKVPNARGNIVDIVIGTSVVVAHQVHDNNTSRSL